MNVKENELLFIYDSRNITDKRALAYAHTLNKLNIRELDLSKEHLTERQLVTISDILDEEIIDMVDHSKDLSEDKPNYRNFSDEELLKMLAHDPRHIQTPIAIVGDIGDKLLSEFELIRKGLTTEGAKLGNFNKENSYS